MSDCGCETGCPPLTSTDPSLTGVTDVATSGSVAANGTVGNHITTVGTLSLKNDNATPGNSKYYGTNGAGTKGFFSLPDGSVTQITFADSITSTQNPLTTLGTVNLVNDAASPGNDQVYRTDGAGVKGWGSFPVLTSPLTTKGDLFTFSVSDARLAVGSNAQILVANSATATGLEWKNISAAGITASDVAFTPSGTIVAVNVQNAINEFNVLTTKGDILGFSTVKARIPVGTNNQVIVADSTQTLGLKWANVPRRIISITAVNFGLSPYLLLDADDVVQVDTSGGAITINLSLAATYTSNRPFTIKDISNNAGTNNITINTSGGQTLDGATSYIININSGVVTFYKNGSSFYSI